MRNQRSIGHSSHDPCPAPLYTGSLSMCPSWPLNSSRVHADPASQPNVGQISHAVRLGVSRPPLSPLDLCLSKCFQGHIPAILALYQGDSNRGIPHIWLLDRPGLSSLTCSPALCPIASGLLRAVPSFITQSRSASAHTWTRSTPLAFRSDV